MIMTERIESLTPLLVCRDIAKEQDFLVNILGFARGELLADDAGNAIHGEVSAGAVTVYLHALAAEHRLEAPAGSPNHGGFVVYVDDVDAHHASVLAAGVTPDSAPVDQDYGQREYGVTDPEGHRWWIATRL